jgi:hypothetical protein
MKKITSLFAPVVNWFKPNEVELKEAPRFEDWYHKVNPVQKVPNADEFYQVLYDFKFNNKNSINSHN